MHLLVVGLSHKTAPIEIRERLTFPAHRQAEALALLLSQPAVAEAVIISTCNRTEIYAVASGGDEGVDSVIEFMADYHELDRHELIRSLYITRGVDVVHHLFRVVASLDSMVIGEAQILGQVKEAYDHAMENGATGLALNKLFRQSFEVGKRVRNETGIGENAVSISYAAIELAKKVFDTLSGRTILILGAGKMSELTAKHLVSNGVKSVLVANRTFERAQELAERFNGEAIRYDDLYERMRGADIVITSTAATHYVITKEQVASAMRGRGGRPLFLIDIAVPRDIEPTVNDLSNVFLYDIDDLSGVVESNLEERMREAGRAEHIIAEEIALFVRWRESLEVVPTVAAIRAKAEVIRLAELEKACKRLGGLSQKDRETIEALTCAIVNKMLHGPTQRLKQAAAAKDGYEYVETARHLYGLEESEARGHGKLRNLLNRRAHDTADKQATHEIGDSLGC
ncbi:MAG: glutamyl-tRNA reductase [Actinomycetota bacterium]|nr:MAG: glutamyl-tRNA [Actinomycetota bacterium]MDO8950784.1 glutamyl-tRNA reductase [Actinomycetota bacterium]MDP3629703.1 glutamyl-tRNA reductase [Actinomycetota bacterium]